jgi:MFS family permease
VFWRYKLLSGLFGGVFGIRFTLDVWVFNCLMHSDSDKFEFIAIAILGMLIGELVAGPLSDRAGRQFALNFSAIALLGWASAAALAIGSLNGGLLVPGAILFGIGFGLFHSALDAWFADAVGARYEAMEFQLTQGYAIYNCGYLLGAVVAFPLLLNFHWNASVLFQVDASSLHLGPYLLAIVMLSAIEILTLLDDPRPQSATAAPPPSINRIVRAIRDYRTVLTRGGHGLLGVLSVAGSIALIVQLIDHLAPSMLLPGPTLLERSISILIFNLTVCVCVGLLQLFLWHTGSAAGLSELLRGRVIKVALTSVAILLTFCLMSSNSVSAVGNQWIGLVLGIVQAVLLMLPPLVKAWGLEYNVDGLYGTTLAILGIGKRLFVILGTMAVPWITQAGGVVSFGTEDFTLYGVTTGVAVMALGIMTFIVPRKRRSGPSAPC